MRMELWIYEFMNFIATPTNMKQKKKLLQAMGVYLKDRAESVVGEKRIYK